MFWNNCFIFLIFTAFLQCFHCLLLKGVTISSPPFVMKVNNNHFEGYAIDLINELSKIMKFNYTLYQTPDDTYGTQDKNGKATGMIQELFMRRADFAIADLTTSETRQRYVEFTEPFMELDLTALIHRKNIGNMSSFEDLLNQDNITYGALREGETYRFMSISSDPTIISMQRYIYRNAYNLVSSRQEGIQRALNTNYAFIQESVANEYAMDLNCDLTVIDDAREIYPRQYAIGLQQGSPYRIEFNKALNELKNNGMLDKLKRKYYKTKCLSAADSMAVNFFLIASALISYIMFN